MFNMLRLLTAIGTLVGGTAVPHGPAGASASRHPAIITIGMSTSERDAVVRTAGLFAEAGLELPAVTTLGELLRNTRFEALPKDALLAVNQSFAARTTPLSDGDEVALMPPVSGG